jgi:hypothetical protein
MSMPFAHPFREIFGPLTATPDASSFTVDGPVLIVIADGVISITEPATANFRLASDV